MTEGHAENETVEDDCRLSGRSLPLFQLAWNHLQLVEDWLVLGFVLLALCATGRGELQFFVVKALFQRPVQPGGEAGGTEGD